MQNFYLCVTSLEWNQIGKFCVSAGSLSIFSYHFAKSPDLYPSLSVYDAHGEIMVLLGAKKVLRGSTKIDFFPLGEPVMEGEWKKSIWYPRLWFQTVECSSVTWQGFRNWAGTLDRKSKMILHFSTWTHIRSFRHFWHCRPGSVIPRSFYQGKIRSHKVLCYKCGLLLCYKVFRAFFKKLMWVSINFI